MQVNFKSGLFGIPYECPHFEIWNIYSYILMKNNHLRFENDYNCVLFITWIKSETQRGQTGAGKSCLCDSPG